MTLSAAQLEMRTRLIGASEFGAIAGVDEHMTPLDVFAKKRRGAQLELEPFITEDDAGDAAEVGNFLEDGIATLYTRRTGIEVVRSDTLVHPSEPWVAATPDRLAANDPHGVEIKLVGMRMAHHWDDDTIPPKVVIQCQIGMEVTKRPYWDLAALVGGTDLRIRRIAFDAEIVEDLFALGRHFWETYILADVPPPSRDAEEARKFVSRRYPKDAGDSFEAPDGVEEMIERYLAADAEAKEAKERAEHMKARLCEIIGEAREMTGPWGRVTWPTQIGQVSWKSIAEEIAGGIVPEALVEKHRGTPFRRFNHYGPPKAKKARRAA